MADAEHRIVEYVSTFAVAYVATGTGMYWDDTLYVDHATREVWNVQNNGKGPGLAFMRRRDDAAKWLSFRLNARRNTPRTSGTINETFRRFKYQTYIPHMPVGPYADPTKVVLHENDYADLDRYGETDTVGINPSAAGGTGTDPDPSVFEGGSK